MPVGADSRSGTPTQTSPLSEQNMCMNAENETGKSRETEGWTGREKEAEKERGDRERDRGLVLYVIPKSD